MFLATKMPTPYRVTKNLTTAQQLELSEAMRRAGHTTPQAMEDMIAHYCKRWGVEWSATAQHGGRRKTAQKRKDGER